MFQFIRRIWFRQIKWNAPTRLEKKARLSEGKTVPTFEILSYSKFVASILNATFN